MGENMHYFVNGHMAAAKDFDDEGEGGATAQFAWHELLGDSLLTDSGSVNTNEALASKKQVAFFFSGSWCPWCRALSPMLEDVLKKVKAADPNDTELVHIPVDNDVEAFNTYRQGKPWLAMPYEVSQGNGDKAPQGFVRKKVREQQGKPFGVLQEKFSVGALPTVLVFDAKTGAVVNKDFVRDLGDSAADGVEFTGNAPSSWLQALEA